MNHHLIGARDFSDGTTRPVYADKQWEYAIGDEGERVYGVWIVPADESVVINSATLPP